MPRDQTLPIVIASSASILSSFLFLVICGICGYYNLKQKVAIRGLTSHIDSYNLASHHLVAPALEVRDTTLSNDQHQDQDPEMIKNEAYAICRPRALS